MKINPSSLVKIDQFCDYIPIISTITNIVNIFQKFSILPFKNKFDIDNDPYYTHLNQKSYTRCILLIIPIFGNAVAALYDAFHTYLLPQQSDEAIRSILKLDDWQTEGNKTEACKRIIQCYKNKSPELDLSDLELTSLPNSIGSLQNLKTFTCAGNKLTALPDSIGDLKNLEILFCFENKFTALPNSIGSLQNLHTLYCFNNKLTVLPHSIGSLQNLRNFGCHSNQLLTLPNSIGSLQNLHTLYCFNNKLLTLPNSIGSLQNLHTLYCFNNKLTALPDPIGDLKNLKTLDCSQNNLRTLPDCIGDLKNLKTLTCSQNLLTTLSNPIRNLKNLQTLNCSQNNLTSILDTIGDLQNLETLDCFHNQLTTLPDSIGKLQNLRIIDCSHNQLTTLPDSIGNLQKLVRLNCSNNRLLTSLPNQILQLPTECNAMLENTALSMNLLEQLRAATSVPGYNGPTISFSVATPSLHSDDEEKTSAELLNDLYSLLGQPIPEFIEELTQDPKHSPDLRSWLNRLSWTADSNNEAKKIHFYQAVADILQLASQNKEYRDLFWLILEDASSTCGDRVALSVMHLDLAKQEIELDLKNLKGVAEFLKHGTLAINLLENVAKQKIQTLKFVDQIEVYLAYPVMLKDELNLRISTTNMLHFTLSCVTKEDLETAKTYILDLIGNEDNLINALIDYRLWVKALKVNYDKEMTDISSAAANSGEDPRPKLKKLTKNALCSL